MKKTITIDEKNSLCILLVINDFCKTADVHIMDAKLSLQSESEFLFSCVS
jgi:hypothetical protein